MLGFFYWLTITLFIIVCFLLILLVLIQKGRGGGLSSAFGGGGGSTAFGSKTGDVLTWATSIIFGIFLLLAIAANKLANAYQLSYSAPSSAVTAQPAPAVPAPSPIVGPPAPTPVSQPATTKP